MEKRAVEITTHILRIMGMDDAVTTLYDVPILNTVAISITNHGVAQSVYDDFTHALSHIVREILLKEDRTLSECSIIIDHDFNTKKRVTELETLSKTLASRALALGVPVHAPHMHALDRKILHSFLQQNPLINSESEGQDKERHIVVTVRPHETTRNDTNDLQ